MGTVVIAPVNRIEGHLDINATTDGTPENFVNSVQNICAMFRGFENIMKKRDPRDAPVICSRV
jgi:hydrogenase large subunit